MHIVVVGAGALGCAIGGTLAQGGGEVTLVSRNRAQVAAIERHGLVLRTGSGPNAVDRAVAVRATCGYAEVPAADVVVVLVKSHDTANAVRDAMPVIGAQTQVLTLQNGLGHEETLARLVGSDHILLGVTYAGGRRIADGHVSAGVAGRRTVIGDPGGSRSSAAQHVAATFTECGLPTEVSEHIDRIRWDKLLVNCATGALAAITGLPYGVLYAVPQVRDCALAAVAEGIAVARAAGITLSCEDPEAIWLSAADGLPPDFRTSMLQSLDADARTEIDVINGALVRWGERTGIPTPVNDTLVAAVKGREALVPNSPTTAEVPR